MNKASLNPRDRLALELWRLVLPMPKTAPGEGLVRRPLKSLRKVQASGMPFLPLSR
jgi:hypothetical protein